MSITEPDFQLHVIDALARLETNLKALTGNGQPGRVGKLETDVEALKKARWTVGGIIVGASTVISSLIHFIFK